VTGTGLLAFGIIVAGLVTIVAAVRRRPAGRAKPGERPAQQRRDREGMSPTWPVTLALFAAAVLGLEAASGSVGLLAIGVGVVGVLLAAVAARSRDRSDPTGAARDADRPRQEPGPATTVEP
jgi:hypothetical protein